MKVRESWPKTIVEIVYSFRACPIKPCYRCFFVCPVSNSSNVELLNIYYTYLPNETKRRTSILKDGSKAAEQLRTSAVIFLPQILCGRRVSKTDVIIENSVVERKALKT